MTTNQKHVSRKPILPSRKQDFHVYLLLVCSGKLQPQKVNNNYNNTKKKLIQVEASTLPFKTRAIHISSSAAIVWHFIETVAMDIMQQTNYIQEMENHIYFSFSSLLSAS